MTPFPVPGKGVFILLYNAGMLSAIVLAAGESKRMGRPKQLLPYGRGTILAQVVDNLLASAADEVIVVLGHRMMDITGTLAGRPVKLAVNPRYEEGMSTSIVAGLKAAAPEAQGYMLVMGDQPAVDRRTIDRLIAEYNGRGRGIVVPVYRGRRGNPVIFAAGYKPELLAVQGDIGGRDIVSRHPDDVLEVAVDSPGVVSDIDTPEDYHSISGH
jgi:molybdenum cofactor cytidylyltransferase